MSGHTPGPWTFKTVETSCGICHRIGPFPWKHNKANDACVYVDYPGNGEIERELLANARLMAAAPELFAACLEFVRKCNEGEAHSKRSYAQMKAAIAKATGND